MLDLSDKVVLVAMGSTRIEETILAIEHCQKLIKFKDTAFLTDYPISNSHITHISINNIPSYKTYQSFVVKESCHIISDHYKNFDGHFLFINWDGFVINVQSWTDLFLLYDYIGAPWPWLKNRVGNGGFCLKSKKFLLAQNKLPPSYKMTQNEDVELCIMLHRYFMSHGCRYANSDIGYKFSTEVGDIAKNNSFGFHDFKYHPYFTKYIHETI
jgi:hypothetical protein